ncbi:MAG: polysaccharide deacetylase family protein, partial [Cyanobacteria bacterium REEB65]|nr:polysaccharide deacetylase family protein [Cyanobacteria bacterium REEB65]
LSSCQETLSQVTGKAPGLFRPSYGQYDGRVVATCRRLGLRMVQWSAMVWDWLAPRPDEAAAYLHAQLAPGAVLLLHDGSNIRRDSRAATIAMLPSLLDLALANGYRFVNLCDRLDLLV